MSLLSNNFWDSKAEALIYAYLFNYNNSQAQLDVWRDGQKVFAQDI